MVVRLDTSDVPVVVYGDSPSHLVSLVKVLYMHSCRLNVSGLLGLSSLLVLRLRAFRHADTKSELIWAWLLTVYSLYEKQLCH